jgi:hypothetical protein
MSPARTLLLALCACVAGLLLAFVDRAPAAVETVLQDDAALLHGTPETIREDLGRIRELGIHRVRLTAGWGVIAPAADQEVAPEFDAEDPAAYPKDAWNNLDRAVRLATEAGLAVNIDIAFWAPRWAVASADDARPRTGIDIAAYARFARAVRLPATSPGPRRSSAPTCSATSPRLSGRAPRTSPLRSLRRPPSPCRACPC